MRTDKKEVSMMRRFICTSYHKRSAQDLLEMREVFNSVVQSPDYEQDDRKGRRLFLLTK